MCCVCNLAINNEETLPFVTLWVNLEGIMLSEVILTERQIHTACSQLSRIQEKQKIPTKFREKEMRFVAVARGRLWEKRYWRKGSQRYKLPS